MLDECVGNIIGNNAVIALLVQDISGRKQRRRGKGAFLMRHKRSWIKTLFEKQLALLDAIIQSNRMILPKEIAHPLRSAILIIYVHLGRRANVYFVCPEETMNFLPICLIQIQTLISWESL